jgi:hypothetical protein
MKKLLVVILVLTLTVFTALPAFAARGMPPVRTRVVSSQFTLAGIITAVDASARTITIRVLAGSRSVFSSRNYDVTVLTTLTTRYLLKTADGTITTTFDLLEPGQKVSVQGSIADDVWNASRITVGALLQHHY